MKIRVFPRVYEDLTLPFFGVFGNGDFTSFSSVSGVLRNRPAKKRARERASEQARERARERERER